MAINSVVVATASVAGPAVAALASCRWRPGPGCSPSTCRWASLVLLLGARALPHNAAKQPAARASRRCDVVLNVLMFSLVFLGADRSGARGGGAEHGARLVAWALLAGRAWRWAVVYLRRQRALAVPLFPVDLLRIPVFALSMGTSVTAFCAQMLAFIALPFLLLEV